MHSAMSDRGGNEGIAESVNTTDKTRTRQALAASLTALAVAMALTCIVNSSRWVGATFPGFFVMSNRVIASVTLPHWSATTSDVFQHEVIAVDGVPVASAREVYAIVSKAPPGTLFEYRLSSGGVTTAFRARSLRFNTGDYVLIFVPYLISGLGLALIGIVVWYSKPDSPASLALLIGGLSGGIFAITGTDLYSPYWFFRLHILGEAFFPASLLIHVAAVFPVDRFRRGRKVLLSIPYLISAALAVPYEFFLYRPTTYTFVHDLCMDYAGFGGAILLFAVVWDFFTSQSQLVRQRIRVLLLGFLGGFAFPGILMFYSGVTGGQVAVNYAGFTVILFPLSIGYAVIQHDLFEIDALVKRSVYYICLTATVAVAYLGILGVTDWLIQPAEFGRSPVFPLLFTFAVVLVFNPVKDFVQSTVDRVFFRMKYNPKKMLEVTSAALASTLQLDDIVAFIWNTIGMTMPVMTGGIFLWMSESRQHQQVLPQFSGVALNEQHSLVVRLAQARGHIISRYNLERDLQVDLELRSAFDLLGVELLIPLALKDELVGFIALGKKESGGFFSVDDIDFLRAFANQSALSIANALAYREIQTLNAVLEERVSQRTEELSNSNLGLQASVVQLEQAYSDLQRSQEDLSRAEKMATLGRLAAGIAHEMNTPLGASMTSLKLLQELVDEYSASAADPMVTASDHREIAIEMRTLVGSTRDWLRKAAAHIGSLKVHTRALQTEDPKVFPVLQIVEDVRLLLSHRLRLSQSHVQIESSTENPMLFGDPGKLGQVLTNLLSNAIDANRDAARSNGEIRIKVREEKRCLVISVQDQGPGISPDDMTKIFDEFYSTKPTGEGTGLGLSIARDIISNYFKGTISVSSVDGEGSTFTLELPRSASSLMAPKAA
jgi:signal transduction histidine kinase